jgi:hypothetical protein
MGNQGSDTSGNFVPEPPEQKTKQGKKIGHPKYVPRIFTGNSKGNFLNA